MIDPNVYAQPVPLDRVQHRALRMTRDAGPPASAARLNAAFIVTGEFADVSSEYPIVFVHAGTDRADPSKTEFAPMAVLGLKPQENLFFDGTRWDARYVPAMLRRHPFAMARIDATGDQRVMVIDRSWDGFSDTAGEPLFDAAGEPTPLLERTRGFVEQFEAEAERTRRACSWLRDAGLLEPRRFTATLPDESTLTADGFFAIDEAKLAGLPDAAVLEAHRSGLLAIIHMQRASLGLMRRLVERRLARGAAPS